MHGEGTGSTIILHAMVSHDELLGLACHSEFSCCLVVVHLGYNLSNVALMLCTHEDDPSSCVSWLLLLIQFRLLLYGGFELHPLFHSLMILH